VSGASVYGASRPSAASQPHTAIFGVRRGALETRADLPVSCREPAMTRDRKTGTLYVPDLNGGVVVVSRQ